MKVAASSSKDAQQCIKTNKDLLDAVVKNLLLLKSTLPATQAARLQTHIEQRLLLDHPSYALYATIHRRSEEVPRDVNQTEEQNSLQMDGQQEEREQGGAIAEHEELRIQQFTVIEDLQQNVEETSMLDSQSLQNKGKHFTASMTDQQETSSASAVLKDSEEQLQHQEVAVAVESKEQIEQLCHSSANTTTTPLQFEETMVEEATKTSLTMHPMKPSGLSGAKLQPLTTNELQKLMEESMKPKQVAPKKRSGRPPKRKTPQSRRPKIRQIVPKSAAADGEEGLSSQSPTKRVKVAPMVEKPIIVSKNPF